MGVAIPNLAKVGGGLHHRLQELNTDELGDLAFVLRVSLADAPETDLHEWTRQRILDDLAGGSYRRGGIVEPRPPELHHFRPASIDTREPRP